MAWRPAKDSAEPDARMGKPATLGLLFLFLSACSGGPSVEPSIRLTPNQLGLGCLPVVITGEGFRAQSALTVSGSTLVPRDDGFNSFSMGPLANTDEAGNFTLEVNLGGILKPGGWLIVVDSTGTPRSQAEAELTIYMDNDCVPIRT